MKLSREFKTGLVLASAIILFIWGFTFLKGKGLFQAKIYYYSIYNQVGGLVPSSPVFINGVKVGIVNDVYFEEKMSGLVVVKLLLNKDFPIPSNSVARIFSSDLMGSKAVEIVLGNSPIKASPGDTLPGAVEDSLKEEVNQQVAPLKRKAEEMLSSFDSVLTALQSVFNENTRNDISQSFNRIRVSLENIQRTTSNIDTLVYTQKGRISNIIANVESISSNLRNNNQEITAIISNLNKVSDTLAKIRFQRIFDELDKNLSTLSLILQKIEAGEGSAGLLLNNDSLYINLNRSTRELELLLQDIRKNPGRYVKFSLF
ncbi:MAG: phospholipid/cholesterol/gamma-HCH transport system substrate-binding protein [Bacteroidales bacterium]|nr:phospholipid/cholesterol/gamma-HCH transport system substrate-binding protein [Bacteroidales bacterium]MDN5329315.1 phospholipid/cholesterol/gamma-HCH transport system substrate-binding protein [Bacteroidales bacterium]